MKLFLDMQLHLKIMNQVQYSQRICSQTYFLGDSQVLLPGLLNQEEPVAQLLTLTLNQAVRQQKDQISLSLTKEKIMMNMAVDLRY